MKSLFFRIFKGLLIPLQVSIFCFIALILARDISAAERVSIDHQIKSAEKLAAEALDLYGLGDRRTTVQLLKLADLYIKVQNYAEARDIYEKAVGIKGELAIKENSDLGRIYYRLGVSNFKLGDLIQAENFFLKSIAFSEKNYGPEAPILALDLLSLAKLYKGQERYEMAAPLYLRGIAIIEKSYGTDELF